MTIATPDVTSELSDAARQAAQLEAMDVRVTDIQLGSLGRVIDLTTHIENAEIERTIDGASTLRITVLDTDRTVLNSGVLMSDASVSVDGLVFRLVAHSVIDRRLTLTFEDEIVAILRTYSGFKKANRDRITRAQFARQLVREVTEQRIEFISPELREVQPIAAPTQAERDKNREFGLGSGAAGDISVKGVQPNGFQVLNIEGVLDTGVRLGARRKLLITSMMVIIQESNAMNLPRGAALDGTDSTGLFQQRPSQGWPGTGVVSVDAEAFFRAAQREDKRFPRLTHGQLAQNVQRSAFPRAYDQWQAEAERIVAVYGYAESNDVVITRNEPFFFSRGEEGEEEPEDTWTALQRLAKEVNWRCFVVSGSLYFISEDQLIASAPRAEVNDKAPGVIGINADFDSGQELGDIEVVAQIGRWSAPPGTIVRVTELGPLNGKWIVNDIRRSLFRSDGTISLRRLDPKLPEPAPETVVDDVTFGLEIETGNIRDRIVAVAREMLSRSARYTYGTAIRPYPPDIFSEAAYHTLDCSSFATLVYKTARAPDPNNLDYNGAGYTGTMRRNPNGRWTNTPLPGDLVHYGRSRTQDNAAADHVGIYIGDGMQIQMGGSGITQKSVNYLDTLIGYITYLVPTAAQVADDAPTINVEEEVEQWTTDFAVVGGAPNLIGLTLMAATAEIARLKLRLAGTAFVNAKAANEIGFVVGQIPGAGSFIQRNAFVTLTLARAINVPDVRQQHYRAVVALLESLGFTVNLALTETAVRADSGIVWRQSPISGFDGYEGLQVSLSAFALAIPDVVGLSEAAAVARIRAIDFQADVSHIVVFDPADFGNVINQDPTPGTLAFRNTEVRIGVGVEQ